MYTKRIRQPQTRHPKRPPLYAGNGPPDGLRVGIYHRVSTTDQDPTLPRDQLAAWAERHGHVALRIEESASGAWNARPGLQRLLQAARKGAIDCVAVYKLDRFGRSALDVLANVQHLVNAGVRFVCVSQGLDIRAQGDAMSQLMLSVLAAVAEFERSLISERTRLGMAKAKANGTHCGRPRLLKPSGEEVARLREKGKSWNAISHELGATIGLCRLRYSEWQRAA